MRMPSPWHLHAIAAVVLSPACAAMLAKSVGVDGLLLGVMTEPELQLELGAAPRPARCYAPCSGISD